MLNLAKCNVNFNVALIEQWLENSNNCIVFYLIFFFGLIQPSMARFVGRAQIRPT